MPAEQELKLTLASELREINLACRRIDDFCALNAVAKASEHALHIVLDELISNTVSHGRSPPTAPIDVRLILDEGIMKLEYIDRGRPFDPLKDLPPDTRELPIEQRQVGGLGWPLILNYCELDDYRYIDGENHYAFVIRAL